jgi:hypothetical protein
MKLFNSPSALEIGQMISQTAHELAQRLLPQSLEQIGHGLNRLSLPAARGYVRAKVGGLVRAEISRLAFPAEVKPVVFQDGILEHALESLTQLILGAALKQQRLGEERLMAA